MADKNWVGGDVGNENDWGTAANWDPALVPVAAENVFILDSIFSIDGSDQSAVDLGNVTVGPGFTGNIGSSATQLILSFGASKRMTIDGASALTTQEMWIDLKSANAVDFDVVGYGAVTDATMDDFGVHLRRSLGTVSAVNTGNGILTVDTGTISSLVDGGSAKSNVKSAAVLTNYTIFGSGVISNLSKIPTVSLLATSGTLTVDATNSCLSVELHGDATVNWVGGGAIGTILQVFSGTFDTSQATRSTAIGAVIIHGDETTTLVDLSVATSVSVENHATGAVLIPSPASSLVIT